MPPRAMTVVAYDPEWPERFLQEKRLLNAAFADAATEIFHIGSTAVPGLAAKPIIDILVATPSLAGVDDKQSALAALGYVAKGENGIVGRRYFQKGGAQRSHHLHVYQDGDPNLHRHLIFRDYLRSHPAVVKSYSELKIRMAEICQNDSVCYQNGKSDFVRMQETLALEWCLAQSQ